MNEAIESDQKWVGKTAIWEKAWGGRWGEDRKSPGVTGVAASERGLCSCPHLRVPSTRVQCVPLCSFRGCGCPPQGAHPPHTRHWWGPGIEQRLGERTEACRLPVQGPVWLSVHRFCFPCWEIVGTQSRTRDLTPLFPFLT